MSILTVAAGTVSSPLPVLAGSRKHMHPTLGTPGRNCCRGKRSRGFGNPVHTRLTSMCIQNLICQVRADWRRLSPPPSCLGYSHTSSRPGSLGVTLPDMVVIAFFLDPGASIGSSGRHAHARQRLERDHVPGSPCPHAFTMRRSFALVTSSAPQTHKNSPPKTPTQIFHTPTSDPLLSTPAGKEGSSE